MIKKDQKNARIHTEESKQAIHESLKKLGAGRSILIDAENTIIAGNGVFEQAQKLNIPIKIIETDGKELIAVKRKDLTPDKPERTALALADNRLTELSFFDPIELTEQLKHLDEELKRSFGFEEEKEISPKTIKTKPYTKTHILLSFPPELFQKIEKFIQEIITLDEVEYEQTSN